MSQGMILRRGGGTSYLFTATAYATAGAIPASGNENDIAIVTSTAIPAIDSGGIIFSNTQPTLRTNGNALQVGDIWFLTGVNSNFPFVAVNGIYTNARAAYQYNGSSWVSVEAYIYYSSAWMDFYLYLYNYGDEYSDVTGGISVLDNAVKGADYLNVYSYGSSGSITSLGLAYTANKIDVTEIDTIHVFNKRNSEYTDPAQVILTSNVSTTSLAGTSKAAYVTLATASSVITKTNFDVSGLIGEYYVAIWARTGAGSMGSYVYAIICE